ncbi:hypothetical protein IEQ34_013975 [Dendrobium chrysotoxum]|uniref:DNA repair protein RAD51 homolog 3 n=1 Tax=Dendrobium chrysotoxum TaxID=161865 RepID=A0AAV7GK84_DENCH|nr:hypothetical protein IEQ34_013975 [Dendrobium chrysotoxum]
MEKLFCSDTGPSGGKSERVMSPVLVLTGTSAALNELIDEKRDACGMRKLGCEEEKPRIVDAEPKENQYSELIIPHREAVEIIKVTLKCSRAVGLEGKHAVLKGSRTAWEMLSDEQNLKLIRTGSEDFDGILGGGIHCGQVTEMGGVPGIGKTQLGIQLAVNVQIPVSYGGLGAKAIYIDTEGSFMPERAYQIAEACIMDTWENLGFSRKEIEDCQERMQPDHFLANILYFRICSYTEQIAVINYLDKFLEEHKDVKIVIIDSISFHFRQDFKEMVQRTIVLNEMSRQLMKLAERFAVAVLLLNHVTAKHTEGSFQLTLALELVCFPSPKDTKLYGEAAI